MNHDLSKRTFLKTAVTLAKKIAQLLQLQVLLLRRPIRPILQSELIRVKVFPVMVLIRQEL